MTRSFDVFVIYAWTSGRANNRDAGDLRRHRAHYDVIVLRQNKEDETHVLAWRDKVYEVCEPCTFIVFLIEHPFWFVSLFCFVDSIHAMDRITSASRNEHYDDVIMTTIASQITSLTVVYSTVYSDADQSKHQSSASLAFVWGIHRDRWIPRTKGQLRGKCFHLMTSPWITHIFCVCIAGLFWQPCGCHNVSEIHMKYICIKSRESKWQSGPGI